MKKIIFILMFLGFSIGIHSMDLKPNKIYLNTGIHANYLTDYNTLFSFREGLTASLSLKMFPLKEEGFLTIFLSPAIKSNLTVEGGSSMQNLGKFKFNPVYLSILPGIKNSFYLGKSWLLNLSLYAGINVTQYSNLYPELTYYLDSSFGVAWYCFKNSGFEVCLTYSATGDENIFHGLGANLLYTYKFK